MARILVIRFSALGDVVMSIPVIYSMAIQHPQHEILVLSRAGFKPVFQSLPVNVKFIEADLKGRHKGLLGLSTLFSELKAMHLDYVADFHDVIRSKYLRWCFSLAGVRVASIDKGRREKRKLIRRHHKILKKTESSFERYADVFRKMGFQVKLDFQSIFGNGRGEFSQIEYFSGQKGNQKWIGIAPFAKHVGKIYPIEKQEEVLAHFAGNSSVKVFLFGGGKQELEIIDSWTAKYPSIISTVGKLNLSMELNLMSYLDVMLSMDSANMHLASLVNVPVVSVWGATHPYAGFMGWAQQTVNTIQLDMSCRPCSVFGQVPCWRGDYACLWNIKPEQVIEKIENVLKKIKREK